jgi:hypothetical protein
MGSKGLNNETVKNYLRASQFFFSFANVLIFGFAIYQLFGRSGYMTFAVLSMFISTYFVPPILFDAGGFFCNPKHSLLGIGAYVLLMPMYTLLF